METLKKVIFTGWSENKTYLYLNLLLGLVWVLFVEVCLYDISYWNQSSFLITLGVLAISTLIDHKTYGNLSTWSVFAPFCYILWWFLLNMPF
jgi:hypothetical protein